MEANVATGIFPGFNDKEGIMLCGYEWGGAGEGSVDEIFLKSKENTSTFATKAEHYGDKADKWPYDKRIMTWFELWGHKLDRNNPGAFEKTLLQTNWCNTQAVRIEGNYWIKLLADEQVENFIWHINCFKPRLLMFFGSEMIKILQQEKVLSRFMAIMGDITEPLKVKQDPTFPGRKFRISFQAFEKCNIISLPHPSSSRGLSNEYVARFTTDIDPKIKEAKRLKGIL